MTVDVRYMTVDVRYMTVDLRRDCGCKIRI